MPNALEAVLEEVKRLKQEGSGTLYLSDETATLLKGMTNRAAPGAEVANRNPQGQEETNLMGLFKDEEQPRARSKRASKAAPAGLAPIPEAPQFELPAGDRKTQWKWLRERVLDCPVCNEHVRKEHGKKVVFGVGSLEADIFFCGEAPGADEETQGEPFVGRAGQLLTKIIGAMGLQRDAVYISNIMNWRPEMPNMAVGNRPPTAQEMAFCLPYLQAQLQIVRPRVIVALGATAVKGLLGEGPNMRMRDLRGHWNAFDAIPLMVTYHPSYLLRNDTMQTKRAVWEDMLLVMEKIGLPVSDKQRGFFLGK